MGKAAVQEKMSPDFESALVEEHRTLATRIRDMRERANRLRALAEQAEENASRDERLLAELEGLLGRAPQLRIEELDRRLRGQRLQEVAVEILGRWRGVGTPVHYREWFEQLCGEGHLISGKDPLANFLAHVSRAPGVESVGKRTGLYVLRDEAA